MKTWLRYFLFTIIFASITTSAQQTGAAQSGGLTFAGNSNPLNLAAPTLPGLTATKIHLQNQSTGDVQIFTVPAGKRGFIVAQYFNPTGSSITTFNEVSLDGGSTYRRLSAASSLTTRTGVVSLSQGALLDAGGIFAVNVATNNGLNIFGTAYTFDATAGLRSVWTTSFISGNNTVYTCCATGKTQGTILQMYPGGGQNSFLIFNGTGSAITYSVNVVNSGDAVGTANQIIAPVATLANLANASPVVLGVMTLATGDFINFATDNAGTQTVFVNVYEQ